MGERVKKVSIFLIVVVILSGCASSGHVPSYIISHTTEEEIAAEEPLQKEENLTCDCD